MLKIGQKVRYDPFKDYIGAADMKMRVTGEVMYINEKRGWFVALWDGVKTTLRISDIGKDVRLVK